MAVLVLAVVVTFFFGDGEEGEVLLDGVLGDGTVSLSELWRRGRPGRLKRRKQPSEFVILIFKQIEFSYGEIMSSMIVSGIFVI